jgi:ubiquinol-cytochrome c reductase cytochrome c1 subunit
MASRSKLALLSLLACLAVTPVMAGEGGGIALKEPAGGWPEQGPFGTYDRASLQRGFQVYKQVCSTCHSMKLLSYRDLTALGFSDPEVKAIAAEYQVSDGPNDNGDMFQRPGRPSDRFVSPFANDQAARAANRGALPPDLSLIVKARHGNESYVYSLLTGFGQTPAAGETIATGMYYNPYFPGHQIAMPPPLSEGAVSFADGTPATVDQMAKDVAQFLAWTSEPHLEERHETGFKVMVFLIIMAGVMYGVKKKIWSRRD